MKKYLIPGMMLIIFISSGFTQSQPLSSNLFTRKESEKTEPYQCIQIRRGDTIVLSGTLSMYETGDNLKYLMLSSDGGRIFLLKGELLPELDKLFLLYKKTEKLTLTGTILFEGIDRRPAEMEVTEYRVSD